MRDSFLDDDIDMQPIRRRSAQKKSRDEMHSQRVRSRSRDFEEPALPVDVIKYIALVIMLIATAVCGTKFLGISLPIMLIVLIILVVMAILLHNTPVFVSVLLAAAILIVGMITGNTDMVLCAVGTYLATALIFREQ